MEKEGKNYIEVDKLGKNNRKQFGRSGNSHIFWIYSSEISGIFNGNILLLKEDKYGVKNVNAEYLLDYN